MEEEEIETKKEEEKIDFVDEKETMETKEE